MLKNRIYNFFVRRNGRVWYEYERYVREHITEHKKHRLKHISILIKLNWFYCIKKGNVPYLYPDVPMEPINEVIPESNNNNNKSSIICSKKKMTNSSKKVTSDKREPYIGCESERIKRSKAHHYVKQFMIYETISFDIFDTLLFRPFDDPKSLFYLVGCVLNVPDFYTYRINAEKKARAIKLAKYNNDEVTIQDIYDVCESEIGIDAKKGIEAEIEVEMDLIYANPFMKRVFDILKVQGKKIYLITDMYLPRYVIEKMLSKCGIEGYDSLIVSNEVGCSKKNGTLFNYVEKSLGIEISKWIHVGDNTNGDYSVPNSIGIKSVLYQNCNKVGSEVRADRMSRLIGSAYKGVVNNHIYNGIKKYSAKYEYGFIYGGIYVLGYCNWIHRYCSSNNVDKVVFVARDGDILKNVYDRVFPKDNTEYLYWSRIAAAVNLAANNNKQYFIEYFINQWASEKKQSIRLRDIFEKMDLNSLIAKWDPKILDLPINEETRCEISEYLKLNWLDVKDALATYGKYMGDYVRRIIGVNKKICIVDVGWSGKSVIALKEFIEELYGNTCDVKCLLAGFRTNVNSIYENNGSIEAYIFSETHNKVLRDIHVNHNIYPMDTIFELFTQSKEPSFIAVNKTGFIFDSLEIENYLGIDEIHRGIIDFAETYARLFSKYAYMMNISGSDAFYPYAIHIRNLNFIRTYLGDMVMNTRVMALGSRNKTVKEILTRK